MLDAAKGLSHLHGNGTLHRDRKPANVPVFSLDEVLTINGKLKDFGSSRNVNTLVKNMTFTKVIGSSTPTAPEVLNREKHKKAVDLYSFGTMMYECFSCAGAYHKNVLCSRGASRRFVRSEKLVVRPGEMIG